MYGDIDPITHIVVTSFSNGFKSTWNVSSLEEATRYMLQQLDLRGILFDDPRPNKTMEIIKVDIIELKN